MSDPYDDLEIAHRRIAQLESLNQDAIDLVSRRGMQYRQCHEALIDLLRVAERFLADFGSYVNEDDWDLPDSSELEKLILKIKAMKLPK